METTASLSASLVTRKIDILGILYTLYHLFIAFMQYLWELVIRPAGKATLGFVGDILVFIAFAFNILFEYLLASALISLIIFIGLLTYYFG